MKQVCIIVLSILIFSSCGSGDLSDDTIPYLLPFKVEKLILEVIEKNPKENYCLLFGRSDSKRTFTLVSGYSHVHKRTNHKVLIGEVYYPISFIRFDGIYALKNSAESVLAKRKSGKPNEELGRLAYPMYHGFYEVEIDSNNQIVKQGYEY